MTTSATQYRVWNLKNLLYALFTSLALAIAPGNVWAQPGAALNFDGVNDFVEIAVDPILNGANSYTKEAWVRIPDYSISFPNIISSGISFGDTRHFLYINGDKLTAGHNTGFFPPDAVGNPTNFPLNQWVHVAVTYDHTTTTMRLYQDGALVASSSSVPQITGSPAQLRIGTYLPTANHLLGDIDEVRIWNVVRTSDQIKQFRKAELTGLETGLVAYYRFNQGIGGGDNTAITTLAATTGVDGTLTNFTRNFATSNFIGAPGGVVSGSKHTTWDGSAWTAGAPLNVDASIIASTTPSQPGSFATAQLYVPTGVNLSIPSGESVTVTGDVDYINSTIEVLTGGSFIQTGTSVGAVIASNLASRFRVIRTDARNGRGYNFISSPVGNVRLEDIGDNTFASFRFTHDPTLSGSARWVPVPSGTPMAQGIGYTYVQPVGLGTITFESTNGFTGRPRNGNINIPLGGTAGYRFNLVGNPYPSPLSMLTFFNNNSPAAINALYFWIDNNNATGTGTYQTKNSINITATDRIAVAQGFMVEATTTPPSLQFNNGQRIADVTALLRSEQDEQVNMERFKMTVARNGERDELWVAFSESFTQGRDNGYDAAKLDGNSPVSLAARLNDERLAIAALPKPEAGRAFELPLTLAVRNAGSYTIAAEDVPNATSEKLFLEDRTTGEFYYLQAGKSHTLNLQAGNYRDRFFLRRASEVKGESQVGQVAGAYAFDRSLFVQAEGTAQVALFSTMGTEVQRFANLNGGALRRLETNVPASGVYIVKVYTQDGVSERRVWLEK